MIQALKEEYSRVWEERNAFERFKNQVLIFHHKIAIAIIVHAKEVADSAEEHTRAGDTLSLNFAQLYHDWYASLGVSYRKDRSDHGRARPAYLLG